MKTLNFLVLAGALVFASTAMSPAHAAVDAAKAEQQLKENKCSKCHSATKNKSGPSWTKIAKEYKGKADAEQKIIKNITTGPMVKFDDGSEEEHKIIKTKDQAELKNLAQWILAH